LIIFPPGPDPLQHPPDDGAFQAERQIAHIAEQGHFKDLVSMDKRNGILPSGKAPIVPHLPEPPAKERGRGGRDSHTPITVTDTTKGSLFSHQCLKGDDNKKRGYP